MLFFTENFVKNRKINSYIVYKIFREKITSDSCFSHKNIPMQIFLSVMDKQKELTPGGIELAPSY
jgi:hypothetical protein